MLKPRAAGTATSSGSRCEHYFDFAFSTIRGGLEGQDLLAPIYGWFTEGFDTPVLKEAKALLDQMA